MVAPARVSAFRLLQAIELRGAYSDSALNSAEIASLEMRDRDLTTEIVYGTLRWQGWLDYVLSRVVSRSLDKIDPSIRTLLRMSLYQMSRMDRIPDHALVHDAVELAKTQARAGGERFVNGVLRTLARGKLWRTDEVRDGCPPWDAVSLPKWLWDRWVLRYGPDEARDFALSLNRPPPATYRILPLRSRTGCRLTSSIPNAEFSELVPSALKLAGRAGAEEAGFDARASGRQDEASQLIPYLAGHLEGLRVWDACAAPGGKSSILRELCGPQGRLFLSDLHFSRARNLRMSMESQGGEPVHVLVADAAAPPPFRRGFDLVMVDVPCSGLGTLRRNPEIKWRIVPDDLVRLGRQQVNILTAAAESVAGGGLLLYSTCSTEPEENEDVVTEFRRRRPSYRMLRPQSPEGIEEWLGPEGMVRTFPSLRSWDGFFAALLGAES